jgi:uncharacterized protein with HEPN domain
MSKRYPYLLVSDMLQCVEELLEFTQGIDYEAFTKDIKTFRAVLASVLILGEAVRMLDEPTMALCPEIEWHKLRGMRNRLIHEYFDVDSQILWQVATIEAAKLKPHLEALLSQLPKMEGTTNA